MTDSDRISDDQQSSTADQSNLDKLVADRLDLPESQECLRQDFTRSIVKRCWEDQLRLKSKIYFFESFSTFTLFF